MIETAELPHERVPDVPLDLVVIIPTLNEVDNVVELAGRLTRVLDGIEWEAIFVDDGSTDGTPDRITDLSARDRRFRLLRRFGRRGLSSAVMEGAYASTAPVVAVIDADLQHDEAKLIDLFRAVAHDGNDLALGTRYAAGGSVGAWDERRIGMSKMASRLAEIVLKTKVSDPMSGFFAVRRDALLAATPNLSSVGYKVLLDVLASSPKPLRIAEIPYEFRERIHGDSKLDNAVLLEYGELLLDKMIGRWVPVKLVMFGVIGGLGVFVHLAILGTLLDEFNVRFAVAQGAAVIGAMTFNFLLNNSITYHDRQLRGVAVIKGLLLFYLVCSLGALGNVGIGSLVYAHISTWWIAGIAGAVVGSVWNYAASSWLTWTRR